MNGKEILQEMPWSTTSFDRALETDVVSIDDSFHARSAIEVTSILADHVAHLRAAGRTDDLRQYSQMLHDFLARHPRLTRLRDLNASDQVGVRIDTLFQDLYATERITTPATALDLLTGGSRGSTARRAIMEALVERRSWITTTELLKATAIQSRQHLHQALGRLREAGLVTSTAGPTNKHRVTPLGYQTARAAAAAAGRGSRTVRAAQPLPAVARKVPPLLTRSPADISSTRGRRSGRR